MRCPRPSCAGPDLRCRRGTARRAPTGEAWEERIPTARDSTANSRSTRPSSRSATPCGARTVPGRCNTSRNLDSLSAHSGRAGSKGWRVRRGNRGRIGRHQQTGLRPLAPGAICGIVGARRAVPLHDYEIRSENPSSALDPAPWLRLLISGSVLRHDLHARKELPIRTRAGRTNASQRIWQRRSRRVVPCREAAARYNIGFVHRDAQPHPRRHHW